MKKSIVIGTAIVLVSIGAMAFSNHKQEDDNNKMECNMNKCSDKMTHVSLKKGEIFVSFITERKPNTDELLQSYFRDVFSVAMKHGAKPLANLTLDKVAKGEFAATDFVGLSSWPNQAAAISFYEEMPPEKLDAMRQPIWSNLKAFGIPLEEDLSFYIQEDKVYEFKLLWGDDNEISSHAESISNAKGKVVFNLAVVQYEGLNGDKGPRNIALIEWTSSKEAETFKQTTSTLLKEEAFYTHYDMPKEVTKSKESDQK